MICEEPPCGRTFSTKAVKKQQLIHVTIYSEKEHYFADAMMISAYCVETDSLVIIGLVI